MMDRLLSLFVSLDVRREDGQTAVEYALVLALLAVVVVGLVATGLGPVITSILAKVTAAVA